MSRLLCAAFCLAAITATASPLPDYPFVFTTGSAEKSVSPDVVTLRFTVTARDKDATVAAAAVEATFTSVTSILSKASIRPVDIDASAVDKTLRRRWDSEADESIPDGYEVSRTISLTARQLTTYPQMIRALLELPNTADFVPTFGRSDRQKIETELFASAAQSAKERAEAMAGQFGRKLGPAHAISRDPFGDIAGSFGLSSNGPGAGPPPPYVAPPDGSFLAPAMITLSESVNVIYELE